jgi:LPS-assembly protein
LTVRATRWIAALALPVLPAPLAAQSYVTPSAAIDTGNGMMSAKKDAPPKTAVPPPLKAGDNIDFAADQLGYTDPDQVIVAHGNVVVQRDGYRLRADTVTYDRLTGQVVATGNVISNDPAGNRAFGDKFILTDSLRDGAIENVLIVLDGGGRLAANSGVRVDGITTMDRAVYTPCTVIGDDGCSKEPVWKIRSIKVTHNPAKHRISYKDATLDILGVPLLYLPILSHPDGGADSASGLLMPAMSYTASLGLGVAVPYHFAINTATDITLTPWVYTEANPALGFEVRHLFAQGPVQASGLFTYSPLTLTAPDGVTSVDLGTRFQGYFSANGQLQHNANWRSTFSLRYATDNAFTRRYDISYDDTLRNTYALERFGSDSYLSIEGWAFQGQRPTDSFNTSPIALPLINFLWNPENQVLGGTINVNANTLVLTRINGTDMQRGVLSAEWVNRMVSTPGIVFTFTGQLRGDVYHTDDSALAEIPIYAGRDGWNTRFIPAVAAEMQWPFAGPAFGGTQIITPRVQLVSSPTGLNTDIPNEDSRSIDFNTVDLFALNRFPGYDRWEGGTRITYGVEYALERSNFALRSQIGQSYRFTTNSDLLPDGTGLTAKVSDIVTRTTMQIGPRFEITQSLRFDPNTLVGRTNEIDVALGSTKTYLTVAYVKLNRQAAIEDLVNREELRLGGRLAFAKYWSFFGSVILDLTSASEDPTTTNNGFSPVRHRVGIAYEDDCFRIGVSWRHDYLSNTVVDTGNTFLFSIALKNLGPS